MKKFFCGVIFILITLLILLVAREVMVLLHEWAHGTLAWLFGAKSNPFDIHYGGWLLLDVDENVNYLALYDAGKVLAVAVIAFLPVVFNALIYLICIWLISLQKVQSKKLLYAFLFWFTVVNLGEVFSYIPIRTFATHGDVGNFIRVLNISPWVVLIPGIIFVGIATWHLFKVLLPSFYFINNLKTWQCAYYLALVLITYFYWYGGSGVSFGPVSKTLSWISFLLIPILFIICYPSWSWVKKTENRQL